jgi:hypothetical protein
MDQRYSPGHPGHKDTLPTHSARPPSMDQRYSPGHPGNMDTLPTHSARPPSMDQRYSPGHKDTLPTHSARPPSMDQRYSPGHMDTLPTHSARPPCMDQRYSPGHPTHCTLPVLHNWTDHVEPKLADGIELYFSEGLTQSSRRATEAVSPPLSPKHSPGTFPRDATGRRPYRFPSAGSFLPSHGRTARHRRAERRRHGNCSDSLQRHSSCGSSPRSPRSQPERAGTPTQLTVATHPATDACRSHRGPHKRKGPVGLRVCTY